MNLKIGVISDTHGVWHPAIPAAFQGVQAILHAGDVGNLGILTRLQAIAPVTAVRGNCDSLAMAHLPEAALGEFAGYRIGLIHGHQFDYSRISESAFAHFAGDKASIVVHGHTHEPLVKKEACGFVVNPGAVKTGYTGRGPTVGVLELNAGTNLLFTLHDLQSGETQAYRLEW
ncbi:MAG: YfcE family phosphodiesterase [Candidatus Sumerlaea chitinivorans]|nr:YfcE family phosphodiesterase [Candidatus Sumerlaea chitinivorans]